ncbi:MAG: 2-oxoacid:acceptor oxidoreductase family protein [Deltaproteobacteria bacterium]|nr:2-oxoacid:acceptor oxidoreductase family protein [Deltaproteobacteria bacterium]
MTKVKYPGIPTTADGTGMVVWVDTHITQAACAYPITSSTEMGQSYEHQVSEGKKNLWGEPLGFLELESEHSSASSCEGYALAGGRVSNFTSGQGLVLMKEVLFTISGKRLPLVFHIGARALTSHSLNVHAGHDDVMAVADVGWGIVFAKNAQEAGDLALIVRRTSEDSKIPYLNVQDGFLTTHAIENVLLPEPEMMKEYVGAPQEKLYNFMDPSQGLMVGVVQNQDSYMKGKIAQRFYYDNAAEDLKKAMRDFTKLTGRKYDLVESYRLQDAEYAVVGMGSFMETAKACVEYIRKKCCIKIGILSITSFRPFPSQEIVSALKNIKALAVVERVDVPLMQSNPLTTEIKAAFADGISKKIPIIYSGTAGLGGRDVAPADFVALAHMMKNSKPKKRYFTLGIDHGAALKRGEQIDVRPQGSFYMRGHSVGGYGSVTTNKIIATLVADLFGLYVQAFPKYGSEKKGLPTNYFLAVAREKIFTHNELTHVEFVVLNDMNAFNLGNPLEGLADNGVLFIQTSQKQLEDIWGSIPEYAHKIIKEKKIKVLALDTVQIAQDIATKPELIQRMQGIVLLGIFLRATPFLKQFKMTEEKLFEGIERSIKKYFGKKGDDVVRDNIKCVERGYKEVMEIWQK